MGAQVAQVTVPGPPSEAVAEGPLYPMRWCDALARAPSRDTTPTGDQPTKPRSIKRDQTGAGTDNCTPSVRTNVRTPTVHRLYTCRTDLTCRTPTVHLPYTVRTSVHRPCCTPAVHRCPSVHRPWTTDSCSPSVHRGPPTWTTDSCPSVHRWYTVGCCHSVHRCYLFATDSHGPFRTLFYSFLASSAGLRLVLFQHCRLAQGHHRQWLSNNPSATASVRGPSVGWSVVGRSVVVRGCPWSVGRPSVVRRH